MRWVCIIILFFIASDLHRDIKKLQQQVKQLQGVVQTECFMRPAVSPEVHWIEEEGEK